MTKTGFPKKANWGEQTLTSMQHWLESCETDFLLFTQTVCRYCTVAKRVLDSKSLSYTEVNFDHEGDLRFEVVRETGHRTVPVCLDMRGDTPLFVGGSDHLIKYLG